jgi:RNA-binding protein 26
MSMFPMAHANQMNPYAFPPPDMGRGGRGRKNRSKKGGPRAPFSAEGAIHDRSKSTIVVENIPEESFSEEEVRRFFSQFGNIEEVSMQPYKRLAIIKYNKWGSANAAYNSPKVIFDNRFVRVFWYKDASDVMPPSVSSGGEWSGDPSASVEDEPEIDMEEFARRQEEAQKRQQDREVKRAELEQQRLDLEQKQHELLTRHREENEKLQAKLMGQAGDAPSSGPDMLRAKLAALEQEAKLLGLDPDAEDDGMSVYSQPRGGYRGRGGPRGRGFAPRGRGSFAGRGGGNMHAAYAQYSIDNRPKKLAVTGVDFTAPEKDESLRHFLLVRFLFSPDR